MQAGRYTQEILENGKAITRLNARIHEAFKKSNTNRADEVAWKDACAEFHARFDSLAFPGGESTAYERVEAGEPDAVEAALCFLECRPYFFRSGYIWKKLFRKIKQAKLTDPQQKRLEKVIEEWNQYRANKKTQPKQAASEGQHL